MKFNSILTLVVTVLVVVLISAAAIIPIVQEAQNGQTTTANNTDQRYSMIYGDSFEVTIPTTGQVAINGVNLTPMTYSAPLIVGDGFMIYMPGSGSPYVIIQYYDEDATAWKQSGNILSFTFNSGVISYTLEDTTTGTFTVMSNELYYVASDGKFGYFRGGSTYDIDKDETVLVTVRQSGANGERGSYSLKISDMTFTEIAPLIRGSTATSDLNWTVSYTETEYGVEITNIVLSYVSGGETYTIDASVLNSAITVVAPIEYTIVDSGGTIYVLLGIIPMLVFLIPIILIVRGLGVGRD